MLTRTRDLGCDIGHYGDLRYNPTGTYFYLSRFTPIWTRDERKTLDRYHAYRSGASYTMALPSYIGKQMFSSTQKRPPWYNNCHNYKCRAVSYPFLSVALTNHWSGAEVLVNNHYRMPFPASYAKLQHQHRFDNELHFIRSRAWHTMQPRFEGEISMLYFLFELKDFRDIAKYIFRPGRLSGALNQAMRDYKNYRSLDPTLPAAKLHLAYQFAYLPLVADLTKMFKQAEQLVEDAQKRFQLNGLQNQKSHYTELVGSMYDWAVKGGVTEHLKYGAATYTFFTASMTYTYRYKLRNQRDATAAYWGLEWTPEAIWNAIPFSFVADYFISVGKALHMMQKDQNVDSTCLQYCESLLTESGEGYFAHPNKAWTDYVVNGEYFSSTPESLPKIIAGTRMSLYDRTVTSPTKALPVPRFKLPSTAQAKNLVALARCFL